MLTKRCSLCAGLLAAVLSLAAGCATTEHTSSSTTTSQVHQAESGKSRQLVHCVFFTFKPDVRDDQIEEFIRDCYLLKQIPAVRKLDAGLRDERFARDVNVLDYHIGLVVYFDDKAGHDEYSAHPLHQQLINKHNNQWDKVRVFDYTAR